MRQCAQQTLLDVGKSSLGEILTFFLGEKHCISSSTNPLNSVGLLRFLQSPDFTGHELRKTACTSSALCLFDTESSVQVLPCLRTSFVFFLV